MGLCHCICGFWSHWWSVLLFRYHEVLDMPYLLAEFLWWQPVIVIKLLSSICFFAYTAMHLYIFFSCHLNQARRCDSVICLDWKMYGNIFIFIFSEGWTKFFFLLSIITFNLGNLSHRVFCKYLQWQVLLNNDLRLDSQRCIFQKKKKKKDVRFCLFHKDVPLILVYYGHTEHMNRSITN